MYEENSVESVALLPDGVRQDDVDVSLGGGGLRELHRVALCRPREQGRWRRTRVFRADWASRLNPRRQSRVELPAV